MLITGVIVHRAIDYVVDPDASKVADKNF